MTPLELLNTILKENAPGSTVKISLADAAALASLGRHSLGELWDFMQSIGVIPALEQFGLFGRRIQVLQPEVDG